MEQRLNPFFDYSKVPMPEPKKLAELKTLDELPSPTPPITGYRSDDVEKVIMVLPVHGLGVLTLTAAGVGLFTSEEIRPATRSEKDL